MDVIVAFAKMATFYLLVVLGNPGFIGNLYFMRDPLIDRPSENYF
jgi:hypothetical protein